METTNYEDRARLILAEIKEIIDVKGVNLDSVSEATGLSVGDVDSLLSGNLMPNLHQFLALCEISGIAIKLPSVETPKNPM